MTVAVTLTHTCPPTEGSHQAVTEEKKKEKNYLKCLCGCGCIHVMYGDFFSLLFSEF